MIALKYFFFWSEKIDIVKRHWNIVYIFFLQYQFFFCLFFFFVPEQKPNQKSVIYPSSLLSPCFYYIFYDHSNSTSIFLFFRFSHGLKKKIFLFIFFFSCQSRAKPEIGHNPSHSSHRVFISSMTILH